MTTSTAPSASEPHEDTRTPLYEAGTQFSHWRFSPQHLRHTRQTLNAAAVAVIKRAFENDAPGSSENIPFLDADEEYTLVKLYLERVGRLCALHRFPEEVEATAVSYLKRFYLGNTVMDWHPRNVMLTAVFLASKTTNNSMTLEEYISRIPKTKPEDVLDLEFLVCQSLNFEFTVWHAHRAFWGLWLDLQSLPQVDPSWTSTTIFDDGMTHIRASRLTDAELIYTPSQIALACLSMVSEPAAAEWMRAKGAEIVPIIEAIKGLIQREGTLPDDATVREVDRRLRICGKNPEKIPGTRAYNARVAEEERKADEKRRKKAAAAQQAMDGQDPFDSQPVGAVVDDDDDDD